MKHKNTIAAGLTAVALLAMSSVAKADEFGSKEAAAAAGDRSATAKVVPMPSTATVDGKRLKLSEIPGGALCDQDINGMTCESRKAYDARIARKAAKSVTPLDDDCGYPTLGGSSTGMNVYQYAQAGWCAYSANGWRLSLSSRGSWFDLTGGYNNEVSAYGMGDHSGHFSDPQGGGSPWYPGGTGVGDINSNLNGGSWTDRFGSRYRN